MDVFREKSKKNCTFLPRFVFRCCGFSIKSNESILYCLYSCIMVPAALLYPWSNLYNLLTNRDNFDVVANSVFNVVGGFSAAIKLMFMLVKRRRLENLLDELERIQEKRNKEKWSQREVYSTNKKIGVILVLFFIAYFSLCIISLAERFTLDDRSKWRTPISDVTVINITYSPNYEIAWAYQVCAVGLLAPAYVVTDFLIAAITVDLCVQFKIFQNDIKQMFKNTLDAVDKDQVASTDEKWICLNRSVKEMVIRHLYLIDLAGEVEKMGSFMIFSGVTGSCCAMCFAIYYISVLPMLDAKAFQSDLEIGIITCSLFYMCYTGTEISVASESVATACYEIDFVGTDARFQKSLMLIIMRSQKPVKLTVGGFADLSLPVYLAILRSTYTYFMVLRKTSDG